MSIPTPQEYIAIVKSNASRLRQECSTLLSNYVTEEMSKLLRRGARGRLTLGFADKPCQSVDKLFNKAVATFASRGWLLKIDHDDWTGFEVALSNTPSDSTYTLVKMNPPIGGHIVILTVTPSSGNGLTNRSCSMCNNLVDYPFKMCAMCVEEKQRAGTA